MNERIKKLAEQAGIELPDDSVYNGHIYRNSLERFARLIVRECASRLRETDYELMFVDDGMRDPSISDAMLVAASDIEEHFGVEE